MLHNKKTSGLVLAGFAAYAIYKYSRMSVQERNDLVNSIREKGKSMWDRVISGTGMNSNSKTTEEHYPSTPSTNAF